ncbi:MAG: hypothetical protein KDA84_24375, partial [Planctomycetaceae bacterium]|nr:hypothetical protein [Planctomycetaceae bacterium]
TCHTAKNNAQQTLTGWGDGSNSNAIGKQDDNWVLLNEFTTWNEADKHHGSYVVLLQEKSQQMAKVMGVVDENGKSMIHRDTRCIACHSGIPIRELEMDPDHDGLITEAMVNKAELNRGVSCQGCHGTAEGIDQDTLGWDTEHISKWKWRFLDPHTKAEKFNYYDVRSPVSRTRMCLSCHVGNVREGRVVTHEMYAAGHPPLPGFEVETFSVQEPQHWRNFHQKSPNIRKEFLEKTKDWRDTDYRADDLHNTKDLLVGALVNLSEMITLTTDLADPKVSIPFGNERWASGKKGDWPELSSFSCYACHHDLEDRGWRIQRTPVGVPGRPPLHEWPFLLAEYAVKVTNKGAASNLLQDMEKVKLAAVDGPFGNQPELISQGRKLAKDLREYAKGLEDMPLPRTEAPQMLGQLVELVQNAQRDNLMLDYDSARQVVWAMRVIYEDAMRIEPSDTELYSKKPLEERPGWYSKDDAELTDFQKGMAEFQEIFMVDLRKGKRNDQLFGNDKRPILKWDAEAAMTPVGSYNPQQFLNALSNIRSKISEIKVTNGE